MRSTPALTLAAILLLTSRSVVHAGLNSPITFAQPGTVTLTLDYSAGGFDHILEMQTAGGPIGTPAMALTDLVGGPPSPDVLGYTPANIGDTATLGSFAAGQELIFRLTDVESIRLGTPGVLGPQTFTGTSSGNNPSPGDFYTLTDPVDPTTIRVYWEDLFPIFASDPNPVNSLLNGGYDVGFTLTLTPVPEPGTLWLTVAGLATLAWRKRRSAS